MPSARSVLPLLFAVSGALPYGPVLAADASVVGTWQLQTWATTDAESGTVTNAFGEHPSGCLIYTAGGAESVVTGNVRDLCRSKLHSPARRAVTPTEFLKESTR